MINTLIVIFNSVLAFYLFGFVVFGLGVAAQIFSYTPANKKVDWFVAIMSVLAVGLIWPKVLYSAIKVRRNKKRV